MKCNGCGTEKTGEDFHRHNKGGRQPRCKECQRRYHKEHYKKNKAKYVAKAETLRLANRATAMQFINELKAAPCMDCNNSFHPCVMDFDHVRGGKVNSISVMVNYGASISKLQEELSKCELVCSNCHRLRTFLRRENRKGESNPRNDHGKVAPFH